MARFECEECSELDKYVGCNITRIGKIALKITEPPMNWSFTDKFGLPSRGYQTPAYMSNVVTKADASDLFSPKEYTSYISGVGNMVHVIQYLAPIHLQHCLVFCKTHVPARSKAHKGNVVLHETMCP
jgi:hypothetical protein